MQLWLKNNPRLCLIGLLLPALLGSLSLILLVQPWWREWLLLVPAALVLLLAVVWGGSVWVTARLPRVAYDNGFVLCYLPGPEPFAIPLEFVECFFLGSGVINLPLQPQRDVQTRNLVIRLAERATDWAHRELPLELGKWCEGHINIRGLVCEPLSVDSVQRLNVLLYEAQQAWGSENSRQLPVVSSQN
jgi:hypothetical protein